MSNPLSPQPEFETQSDFLLATLADSSDASTEIDRPGAHLADSSMFLVGLQPEYETLTTDSIQSVFPIDFYSPKTQSTSVADISDRSSGSHPQHSCPANTREILPQIQSLLSPKPLNATSFEPRPQNSCPAEALDVIQPMSHPPKSTIMWPPEYINFTNDEDGDDSDVNTPTGPAQIAKAAFEAGPTEISPHLTDAVPVVTSTEATDLTISEPDEPQPNVALAQGSDAERAAMREVSTKESFLQKLDTYMSNRANIEEDTASSNQISIFDQDGHMAVNSDEEDSKASLAFAQSNVEFSDKRVIGDNSRSRHAYQKAQIEEDHSLFVPQSSASNPEDIDLVDAMSSLEDDSGDVDMGMNENNGSRRKLAPKENRKRKETTGKGGVAKSRPRNSNSIRGCDQVRSHASRDGSNPDNGHVDLNELLRHDTLAQARANEGAAAQPGFQDTNKTKAMAELIASIPADQRKVHRGDKKRLLEATKKFKGIGAMKSDGQGKWKLRGMKTALHHYQTIGTAQMRDRERNGNPQGGIMSDEMGFGKTVMAIANIVDGRPLPNSRMKATLIVAPASLIAQWSREITKHTDSNFLNQILTYKAGTMLNVANPVSLLNTFDVVITSYNEVAQSMPKKKYPGHLVTRRAKEEWWEAHFQAQKGVLHEVKWHRIVLDEAQAIKNWQSKTSEACWRLRGRYRWALSGTPIQNKLEEFYGFWRFLRVRGTGDFRTWKGNYCKKNSEMTLKRLRAMLDRIMIRRTHQDQLFGRPILQLPPIKPIKTVELDFNVVEKTIYRIVKARFVARIKACGGKFDAATRQYNFTFVLLLRLRQLTAHILLIQKTLKDLLEAEDLRRLWALTASDNEPLDKNSKKIIKGLHMALSNVGREDQSHISSQSSNDVARAKALAKARHAALPKTGLVAQFRKYLQSLQDNGQWEEAHRRALCSYCGSPPVHPHITPCFHIYCYQCLEELPYEAANEGEGNSTCIECGIKFQKGASIAFHAADDVEDIKGTPLSLLSGVIRTSSPEEDMNWFKIAGPMLQSTKTIAAIQQMEDWWRENKDSKIIIFSAFRNVLKIFSRIFKERRWSHEIFHGEMSHEARDHAIGKFTDDPECKILLMAMKAGGLGLNLTAANRIILIDLYWNVAGESQAFCRAFRIGQTRDVEVVRLAVKNTVDMNIIRLQECKTEEIDSAMDKKNRVGGLTRRQLMDLFAPGEDGDGDGDPEAFVWPSEPCEKPDSDIDEDIDMTNTGYAYADDITHA